MNKISNEENILNLRKRERIRVVMIILCIVIIGLAFASLIFDNFIFTLIAVVLFIVFYILKAKREKIPIRKDAFMSEKDKKSNKEMEDIKKMLNKSRKK